MSENEHSGEGDIRFDQGEQQPEDPETWQPGEDEGVVVGQAADLTPPLPEGVEEAEPEPPLSPNHPASGNLTPEEFEESGYDGPMSEAPEPATEPANGVSPSRDYVIGRMEGNRLAVLMTVHAKNTEGALRAAGKAQDDDGNYILPDGNYELVSIPLRYWSAKPVRIGAREGRGVRVG